MKEAIILAGGEGWRLKPAIWVPKPLLKINKQTLIDHQIGWLESHGFENIIVASNRADLTKQPVTYSLEKDTLGTGGATKKAFSQIQGNMAYVMNVDDIVFYDPNELFDYAGKGAGVLLAKPTLPFGRVSPRVQKSSCRKILSRQRRLRIHRNAKTGRQENASRIHLPWNVVHPEHHERSPSNKNILQTLTRANLLKNSINTENNL